MIAPNEELVRNPSEIARASAGMTRQAANYASMALSATESAADARSALTALWQGDLRECAVDLIGTLACDPDEPSLRSHR